MTKLTILISLFALVFTGAALVDAQTPEAPPDKCEAQKNSDPDIGAKTTEVEVQTDLSVRPVLYFQLQQSRKIDFELDKYVSDGGTMRFGALLGTKGCYRGSCKFDVGFVASRSGDITGELSAAFGVTGGSSKGGTIYFAKGEQTKQIIFPLELTNGKKVFTLTINPNKKIAESCEDNNRISVTIEIIPVRGGIMNGN